MKPSTEICTRLNKNILLRLRVYWRHFRFAEWIYSLLLRKLLDLRLTRGIDRIEKEGNSLQRYLQEIKFASRG